MDDWIRWAVGIVMTLWSVSFGWLLTMLRGKADKDSFEQTAKRLLDAQSKHSADVKERLNGIDKTITNFDRTLTDHRIKTENRVTAVETRVAGIEKR